MPLTRENLLSKSVNDVLDLCLRLDEEKRTLKQRYDALQRERPTQEVKDTNRQLREENRRLRTKLGKFTSLANED